MVSSSNGLVDCELIGNDMSSCVYLSPCVPRQLTQNRKIGQNPIGEGLQIRPHRTLPPETTPLMELCSPRRRFGAMFDPDRLKPSHVSAGWMPVGAKTHAIQGHDIGLKLEAGEREQLIAFLRTL
jgi:hypothetical protein